MLKVEVHSGYSGQRGAYVLEDGSLRWEGEDGWPEPFGRGPNIDGVELDRGILATDDLRGGWIECGPDPERWLRRLLGFLDMRGHVFARVVEDASSAR